MPNPPAWQLPFAAPDPTCTSYERICQLQAWERAGYLLRANPGLPVFSWEGEHDGCEERPLNLPFYCDEPEFTALYYCQTCHRVGVAWNPQWFVPDDMAAVSALAALWRVAA